MTIFNSYVCLPSNEMELFWRRCGGQSVWTALLLSQCVDAPFPAACWLLPDANRLQPSFLVFGVVAKADCFVPWHTMQLRCTCTVKTCNSASGRLGRYLFSSILLGLALVLQWSYLGNSCDDLLEIHPEMAFWRKLGGYIYMYTYCWSHPHRTIGINDWFW